VTDSNRGRMLLSHNFNISEEVLPALSREEFAAIFIEGLDNLAQCRLVDNPHWIVEVLFDKERFSPLQMGELYSRVLAAKRRNFPVNDDRQFPDILILGGIKTTPAISDSPDALQLGDWGVDIVETIDGDRFLESIGWEATIALKPPEAIFKVELKS
jgi:Protein of unknown function (DUF2656)